MPDVLFLMTKNRHSLYYESVKLYSTSSVIFLWVVFHSFLYPVNKWVHPGIVSIMILLCAARTPADQPSSHPTEVVSSFCLTDESSSTITFASIISSLSIPDTKRHCGVKKVLRWFVSAQLLALNYEGWVLKTVWVAFVFLCSLGTCKGFHGLRYTPSCCYTVLFNDCQISFILVRNTQCPYKGAKFHFLVEFDQSNVICDFPIIIILMNKYLHHIHVNLRFFIPPQVVVTHCHAVPAR